VPVIIEQNENSQNANKFQASRFFRVPNIFWAEMIKISIYNFPKQAKISKIAWNFFKHLRKKISWIFPSIGFVDFPNSSAKMKKNQPI
jgi:hypothetical protein